MILIPNFGHGSNMDFYPVETDTPSLPGNQKELRTPEAHETKLGREELHEDDMLNIINLVSCIEAIERSPNVFLFCPVPGANRTKGELSMRDCSEGLKTEGTKCSRHFSS